VLYCSHDSLLVHTLCFLLLRGMDGTGGHGMRDTSMIRACDSEIPARFFSYGCPAHLAFGEDGLAFVFCFYERMF